MPTPEFDICTEDKMPVLMMRVTQLWRQLMDAELAHHGLSQAKWRTLAILALRPEGMIQSELADELGVEGPSLVAMLDRLSKDEWVERILSETDRRCKIIRLTPRAWPLIDEIRISSEKIFQRTIAKVDVAPLAVIEAFFIDLRERLYDDLPEKKRHHRGERRATCGLPTSHDWSE
ncbi:MarR family transcriptional regulator [Halothiobacillus sp.]|uniref:MarR family winged helix-turn-helix transcriptional regulator n=1 Tax=Halothiobacillus sp. TaxID=1891311 RepID=UPI002610319D|nr:MarR family transcriptional regulator [Halothiobacillus sp.]